MDIQHIYEILVNSQHTARASSLCVLSGNVRNMGPYYVVFFNCFGYIYIYMYIGACTHLEPRYWDPYSPPSAP